MTRTIQVAGHTFRLTVGRRYLATRPFATGRRNERFDVKVVDITAGYTFNAKAVATIPGLDYNAANSLLGAFNNGVTSYDGRLVAG